MLTSEQCRPGTLVECIDNTGVPELQNRRIYTVERLVDTFMGPAVQLVEIDPVQDFATVIYWGFCPSRFRVLPDERLWVFRQALASVPQRVEEAA